MDAYGHLAETYGTVLREKSSLLRLEIFVSDGVSWKGIVPNSPDMHTLMGLLKSCGYRLAVSFETSSLYQPNPEAPEIISSFLKSALGV